MPKKSKTYARVIFSPEIINEAVDTLKATLPKNKRNLNEKTLHIDLPSGENWTHDNEDEFFSDYRKGFEYVWFRKIFGRWDGLLELHIYGEKTEVNVEMPSRADVERVFNVFEANVEKCRLPRQPKEEAELQIDWITENIRKVEGRCPTAGRKLKLALTKLGLEEAEEWQNATMLIRDAWIELAKWLCQVKNVDTSDIEPDEVVARLKKLKLDKADERLFNLARASFSLYSKHHKRDLDQDTAVACVISTIVSMKTVIREVFNAAGEDWGYWRDRAVSY